MLDVHPVPPADRVEARGRSLGRLDEREFLAEVAVAERALAQSGLFELEAELEADLLEHFDDVEEMVEVVNERDGISLPAAVERRVRAAGAPIVLRKRIAFRRFRPLPVK